MRVGDEGPSLGLVLVGMGVSALLLVGTLRVLVLGWRALRGAWARLTWRRRERDERDRAVAMALRDLADALRPSQIKRPTPTSTSVKP